MMYKKEKIFRAIISLIVTASLATLSSCEKYVWKIPEPPVIPEELIISFTDHIYPECTDCHSSWSKTRVYDELSSNVDTVTPDNSDIFKIHSSVSSFNRMVQVNDTLEMNLKDVIRTWASQGAKDNK